jgi:hypothetical protein
MIWRETGQDPYDVFQDADLKICDLCGALNLGKKRECLVCGWRGHFETRKEMVRTALDLLRRQHGDLALDQLTESLAEQKRPRGIAAWIKRQFSNARYWLFG